MPPLRSRFLGALLGGAVGDALGERAFFLYRGVTNARPEPLRREAARLAKLGYTDDTAMALALAEVLARDGQVDPERLGAVFAAHHEREPWRGYASGPPAIFGRVRAEGGSYVAAARALAEGGSFGNGAAMRVAPVGLMFCDAGLDELVRQAELSALPTHAHPIGIDGAALIAIAVAHAARADSRRPFPREALLAELSAGARTEPMREKVRLVGELLAAGAPHREAADRLGRGITADRSVPYALFAFLRAPDSFKRCLEGAVLEEGDRDTVGAMAGGMAGAFLGIEGVPKGWWERVENAGEIERSARALYEAHAAPARRAQRDASGD